MKKKFNTEIIIDDKYKEPKIVIYTKTKSKEVQDIINVINNYKEYINAYTDNKLEFVKINDIVRISRVGRKVVLETEKKSYTLRKTLMQLEEELDAKKFIRISQSEIINAYKVKSLNFSFAGTIIIEFINGMQSNVSRRYVKYVKGFFKN